MNIYTIVGIALPVLTLAPMATLALRSRRTKSSKRRAGRDFPQLATQMGLCFTQARSFDELGEIEGHCGAYEVSIRPDFFGTVRVKLQGKYPIALDTNAPRERPEPGMQEFVLGHAAFDRYLSQRYAGPAVLQRLQASPWLVDKLTSLCERWRDRIDHVSIEGGSLTARLEEPHAYDAAAAGQLLVELVDLGTGVDHALTGCQVRDEWDDDDDEWDDDDDEG